MTKRIHSPSSNFPRGNSVSEKIESSTENTQEIDYAFSMRTDIHSFFYIGIIMLICISSMFLVESYENLVKDIPEIKIILLSCLGCSLFGLLFWQVEKKFQFSPKTGILTVSTLRFKIPLFSKTFLIKNCKKFDIQFIPRRNASYFVLHHNFKKSIRFQMKRKRDDINFHLISLNNMLSSIKRENFPSSITENNHQDIAENTSTFDKKRKITRDVDHKIVMSSNYFKFVLIIFPIIPFVLAFSSYLHYRPNISMNPTSPIFLFIDVLFPLNYMGIVYFLFFALRVKNPQVDQQHEKLSGEPVFKHPKFLENILDLLKASYIKPEQVSFYRKMRTGLILAGFIPILSTLVFFFLSLS